MSMLDLATAKSYLRIGSSTAMDSLVQAIIDGAEDWVSEFCGVQFGEVLRTDELDGGSKNLYTRRTPIRHVTSVTDVETSQAYAEDTDYRVQNDRLTLIQGEAYGAWAGRATDQGARWLEGQGRWQVNYLCGYLVATATTTAGPADGYAHYTVPGGLKMAVLEMVRRLYDNRGGVSSESASGWAVNWLTLHESDIVDLLTPYARRDC